MIEDGEIFNQILDGLESDLDKSRRQLISSAMTVDQLAGLSRLPEVEGIKSEVAAVMLRLACVKKEM